MPKTVCALDFLSKIPHNLNMRFSFVFTEEYREWFLDQPSKIQAQIEKRLSNIKNAGHFGSVRKLGDGLAELKFNNGNRIYYAMTSQTEIILEGNKNGQDKDIKKAKSFLGD